LPEPLGIRNNNPGNLDYTPGAGWAGLAKPPYHGRFCAFKTPLFGLQALIQQVLIDHYRHGKNDIASVIASWAPQIDNNNTSAYVNAVAGFVGHTPFDLIDFTDMGLVIGLAQAIVREENGKDPYQANLYTQAANAAYSALKVVPRKTSEMPEGTKP